MFSQQKTDSTRSPWPFQPWPLRHANPAAGWTEPALKRDNARVLPWQFALRLIVIAGVIVLVGIGVADCLQSRKLHQWR